VKKIQCTGCGQIFWTDLQLNETLVSSGEWVQNPCPKCGALWAVVEPAGGVAIAKRGRKAKPGPKRRGRPSKTVKDKREETPVKEEEGSPEMSASGIRKLRKKLGISQKKLGSLVGVSTSAVVSWEKGKFSPRKDKIAQLSDLGKKGKEDVRNLLAEKGSEMLEEKPQETGPVEKVEKLKVKRGKRGGSRKGSRGRKEKK
jgi:transcriptional regulator with XRE-family HTH domain